MKQIKKTNTYKLDVRFGRMKSTWYILPSGEPVGIAMLNQGLVISRVTEEKAKNFFNQPIQKNPKPKPSAGSQRKKKE